MHYRPYSSWEFRPPHPHRPKVYAPLKRRGLPFPLPHPPSQKTRQSRPRAPGEGPGRGGAWLRRRDRESQGDAGGLHPRPLTSSSCCRHRRPAGGWPAGSGRLQRRGHPPPWRAGLGQGLRRTDRTSPACRTRRRSRGTPGSSDSRGGARGSWCSSRVVEPGSGRRSLGGASDAGSGRAVLGTGGGASSGWREPAAARVLRVPVGGARAGRAALVPGGWS